MAFLKNSRQPHRFCQSVESLKDYAERTIARRFIQGIESIQRGNTIQLLLACSLPKDALQKYPKVCLTDEGTNSFYIVAGILESRYINAIFVYKLSRLYYSNIHRSHKRKLFHFEKDKKQTISCRNYD